MMLGEFERDAGEAGRRWPLRLDPIDAVEQGF
jgi:hypothetical protein